MSSSPQSPLAKMPAPALNGRSIAAGIGAFAGIIMFGGLAAWSEAFPSWMAGAVPFILYFIYQGIRYDLKEKAAQAYWRARAKSSDADLDSLVQVCLWHPPNRLAHSPSSKRDEVLRCVDRIKSLVPQDSAFEELVRSFEAATTGELSVSGQHPEGMKNAD